MQIFRILKIDIMKISGYFKLLQGIHGREPSLPDAYKALSGRNSIYLGKLIEFSKSVSINLIRIITLFRGFQNSVNKSKAFTRFELDLLKNRVLNSKNG